MSRTGSEFPLLNRIVVLVMCGGLLIGLISALIVSPKFRQQLDLTMGFVYCVFALMACGGIRLSLFWQNRTPEELEEEAALPTGDQPRISDHALVCRFSSLSGPAAVFVDPEQSQIHFQNCHVPRKLVASAQPWFSCPISDLKGAHVFRYRSESLTIVTATGKALIPAGGANYAQLRQTMEDLVPATQPGFSTDHPMMGMVYLAGALAGIFAGVLLTPNNANDSTMGLFVLAGAFTGVISIHLLVLVADRKWKIGLAQPIGFGMLGSWIGLTVHRFVQPQVGWSIGSVFMIAGFLLGAVLGILKQTRQRRPQKKRSAVQKNGSD